ncbi:hypothetical protein [Anaerococcus obesiensis]|uniref:hypothetical protein n=1 Tax=Anaerococcus obesiensis TaxID=1287640 RepID=UPI0003059391|nr:hypothetical protein [Anaerococcus obesiensis]
MKVKDFLDWFKDFHPESELKFDLFEERINGGTHTFLDALDADNLYEDDTVFVTLSY